MSAAPIRSVIHEFVDAYFRFRPGEATEKGYAKYDDRAPSFADEDLAEIRAAAARAKQAVRGIDPERLPIDDALDLWALKGHLETALFDVDRLNTLETSPLAYVLPALDGLEALELQGKRGDALINRLRGIPRLLAQAEARVKAPIDAFRDVALEMLRSAIEDFDVRYAEHEVGAPIAEAAQDAKAAMARYAEGLERRASDVRPFVPMGEEAYAFLLSNEHLLSHGIEPILQHAHQTLDEIGRVLRDLGDGDGDDDDDDDDSQESKLEVPPSFGWKDVLAYYREELKNVRRFVEEKNLITIPRGAITLRETPEYLRALIPGVSYLPPPAFSRVRRGFLYVRPVPRQMDEDDRQHYYQRVRYRWFRNTIAHEVWPGHHVQLVRASSHPSAIRKFKDNDVMVEGWGLYSESLVREHGIWEGAPPEGSYRALRFRAARVVVDVGIHTGRMTLAGAVDWLVSKFGEGARRWVEMEVRRYATEPTQAMSYLVGQKMIMDLRAEWADAVGAGRFDLRRFHDEFTAEGSLPIPLIRRKMLARAGEAPASPEKR